MKRLKLVIISRKGNARRLTEDISHTEHVRITGLYIEHDDPDVRSFAEKSKIPLLKRLDDPGNYEEADLIICDDSSIVPEIRRYTGKKETPIVTGAASEFIIRLVSENRLIREKENALVLEFDEKLKRFSIQSDLSHIITTTIVMERLIEEIIKLYMRASESSAGTILIFDETTKRFRVASLYGLSAKFAQRVNLPLSDPIIEDLITIRREMVIPHLEDIYSAPLFGAALREGMNSALVLPLLTKEKLIGILCIFSNQMRVFSPKDREFFSAIAGQAAMAIENAQLYKASIEKQRQVEQLLSKVIFAQEEERKRIAGEIHDGIAQSMVGILTKVQTSQALLSLDQKKVPEELEELRKIVTESVREVREIIYNLRPASLDDLGLIPSIENLMTRIERDSGIAVELIANERMRRLPSIFETIAYRIIQEALANVKKHSGAEKAWVELYFEPTSLSIKIVDNGKGFDWDTVSHKFKEGESFGLQSMRERAALVGGRLDIITGLNNGTTVSVIIPVDRRSAALQNSADEKPGILEEMHEF